MNNNRFQNDFDLFLKRINKSFEENPSFKNFAWLIWLWLFLHIIMYISNNVFGIYDFDDLFVSLTWLWVWIFHIWKYIVGFIAIMYISKYIPLDVAKIIFWVLVAIFIAKQIWLI